jgi:hypothetical protein
MTMIRRLILCLCVLGAALVAPVETASAAKSPVPKARATAKKAAPSKSAATAAAKATAAKATVANVTAAKPDAAPARTVAAPRRLEDIHIEGEIPAPQVLFVTARDQRRFTRFHHHRYLKTSTQVGETTLLPNRVALTSPPPTPAGQP